MQLCVGGNSLKPKARTIHSPRTRAHECHISTLTNSDHHSNGARAPVTSDRPAIVTKNIAHACVSARR